MDNAERYRKEFDLIFQELEETKQLHRQSIANDRVAFINKLLSFKAMREFLDGVPLVEDRVKIINECLRAKFPESTVPDE